MNIDLNCDMGESFGRYKLGEDEQLLDIVTSANIACGLHAGDPLVMSKTVQLAVRKGVAVGAHPGYPDMQGFGRRAMAMSPSELSASILYQIGALAGFARVAGIQLSHVKPHGALYNTAARDPEVAEAVVMAVKVFDPTLILVTLPGSVMQNIAEKLGLHVAAEGFADRAYQTDGSLVPRSQPGAVFHDTGEIARRVLRMVIERKVVSNTGDDIELNIDTVCVHGDTPGAVLIAKKVRSALEGAGIALTSLTRS